MAVALIGTCMAHADLPHITFTWATPGGQTEFQPGESTVLSLWASWDDPDWPVFDAALFNINVTGWNGTDSFATHKDWTFGTEDDGGTDYLGRRPFIEGADSLRTNPPPGGQTYALVDQGPGQVQIQGQFDDPPMIVLLTTVTADDPNPVINPIEVFRLGLTAGDPERDITLTTVFDYTSLRKELVVNGATEATFTDATITMHIVPAPASALALLGLAAIRRRR